MRAPIATAKGLKGQIFMPTHSCCHLILFKYQHPNRPRSNLPIDGTSTVVASQILTGMKYFHIRVDYVGGFTPSNECSRPSFRVLILDKLQEVVLSVSPVCETW